MMHIQATINIRPEGGFIYDTFIPSLTHFVYLFLVVSAFSLCCGYYDKIKSGVISPNDFYRKRYSRILPFFAVLVLIDLLVPHSPNKFEAARIMAGEAAESSFLESVYDSFA